MNCMKSNRLKIAACLGLLALAACSEAPKPAEETKADTQAKEAVGPPKPVTGKTAYWEMYTAARNWAKDAMPLLLESKDVPGISNEPGKAAMWSATFGSPSLKEGRVFTYAVAPHPPNIYKGVTIGSPLPWNGPTHDLMPFQMSEVNADSDVAFNAASADASKWLKQHPVSEVSLKLMDSVRHHVPTWFVMWGNDKSGYRALINAMNGRAITK